MSGDPLSLSRNLAGLKAALTGQGVEFRFNTRAMRHEYREGGDWLPSTDRYESNLRERIAETYVTGQKNAPLKFGRDTWTTALLALLFEHEVDPFKDWLESLAPWDGDERLDHWLGDVFRVDDACPLAQWASTFLLLGPVWRTYRPGSKLDEMPVLIGNQGCGKSTALRWLLPPDRDEWFADGLHLASDPKTRAEALLGRVIVEASEMAGSTRADLEALKAFLSRTDDGAVRLAFRHNPEPLPRRCIIAGSANDRNCLPNDPTGNRRFAVVNVRATADGAAGVRGYLDEYREQLWAEALHAYREGRTAYLPDNLKAAQAERNESHRRRDDMLEDKLTAWLGSAPDTFSIERAASGCGLVEYGHEVRLPMRDLRRLGAALQHAGYEKVRMQVDGKRETVWRANQ